MNVDPTDVVVRVASTVVVAATVISDATAAVAAAVAVICHIIAGIVAWGVPTLVSG